MGIKQFLKEKKELIKTNRRLIALGCGVSAVMVAVPSITGVVTAHNKKEKVQQYYEYAKPIKPTFDENGKLIIPTIIDKENPMGNYEYKVPTIKDTKVPEEVKESTYYKQGLPKLLNENKKTLHNQIKEYANFKVNTSKDLILFLDNILPNHNIKEGQEINVSQICDSIYEIATLRAKDNILSNQEISDLCALSGLNFDKEYNNIIFDIENNLEIKGGVGSKPSAPTIPDIKTDYGELLTLAETIEVTKQDECTRMSLAIGYSIVLPVLIAIQTILVFFTIGFSVFALIIDITFAAFEIATAWLEYYDVKTIKEIFIEATQSSLYKLSDILFNFVSNCDIPIEHWIFKVIKYNGKLFKTLKKLGNFLSPYSIVVATITDLLFNTLKMSIIEVIKSGDGYENYR